MFSRRIFGAFLLIIPLSTSSPEASAATATKRPPVAGNQCKKKQAGLVVGSLRCKLVGSKYVWVRAADAAGAAPTPKSNSAGCDPNYTPCVPIDSDVDCLGGKGNGPSYVKGPVQVIGNDIYDLDRDGNGIGCER